MRQLAEDVWQLSGFPPNSVNAYVVGDVLVDAGTALDRRRILRQIEAPPSGAIRAHALTHAHFDHYGSSHAICERMGLPLWCGAADVEAVEAGKMVGPGGRMVPGPHAHPVARTLREGDELTAGFVVLDTPGHSPGHLAYWREHDRVLVCGDVMWGCNPFLMRGAIREPYPAVSPDAALNRTSARRLAELHPSLVLFGHGPPLRDDPAAFAAAVAKLARD